jgi:hypothetical protein
MSISISILWYIYVHPYIYTFMHTCIGAVIQENADIGYRKVKLEEASKMNKRMEYSKNSSPERKKNEHALNMLSSSTFL